MIQEMGESADRRSLAYKYQNIGLVYRRQGHLDQALAYRARVSTSSLRSTTSLASQIYKTTSASSTNRRDFMRKDSSSFERLCRVTKH